MGDGGNPLDVALVYDEACPHVDDARARLRRALIAEAMAPQWREWERSDTRTPERMRAFGSPTVLVAGRDVVGGDAAEPQGDCCRLYADGAGGLAGAPTVEALRAALRRVRGGV